MSDVAAKPFGLVEIKIALWNATGDYGTPVALDADQMLEVDPQADTDELRDSGAITDGLTVVTHAKLKLGFGAITNDALSILAGVSTASSGSTPNRVLTRNWTAAADGLNYWGVIGVMRSNDGGRKILCLPKCKLNTFPKYTLDGKENKFVLWEIEGRAFADGVTNLVMREKDYETASDYSSPTTNTQFEAFFPAS